MGKGGLQGKRGKHSFTRGEKKKRVSWEEKEKEKGRKGSIWERKEGKALHQTKTQGKRKRKRLEKRRLKTVAFLTRKRKKRGERGTPWVPPEEGGGGEDLRRGPVQLAKREDTGVTLKRERIPSSINV